MRTEKAGLFESKVIFISGDIAANDLGEYFKKIIKQFYSSIRFYIETKYYYT